MELFYNMYSGPIQTDESMKVEQIRKWFILKREGMNRIIFIYTEIADNLNGVSVT